MCSNSCADLLNAALGVLRNEAPAHHEALRSLLIVLPINLLVGDELLALQATDDAIAIVSAVESPRVVVTTSLYAARALLEARQTMIEAIARDELDVRGSADALDAAADGFELFLHGLIRAPSSPALLEELCRRTDRTGDQHGE